MDIDEAEVDTRSEYTSSTAVSGTTAPSIYSYSSSRDGEALLREYMGRVFNAKNELYLLPADEGEFSRLDKQHVMLLVAIGRLYIAYDEVEEALSPHQGHQPTILDLGTGGGNWAIGMGQEFPHAQVVGVDLAPSTTRPPPPNCRFEFDDFTLGMHHYHGAFDVVHARSTANGVKDFEWFISEAAKCLRPGGVLLFTEGNFELLNEQKQPQELAYGDGAPGQSWFARTLFEAYNAMKARGSSMDAGVMLERYMKRCPEISDVKVQDVLIPIGPWEKGESPEDTQRKEMMGTLMRQNSKEFVRALKPMFLTAGYAEELVDRFIQGTDYELTNLTVHMYVRWHFGNARRVGTPDEQLEALPIGVKSLFHAPGSPIPMDYASQEGIEYGVVHRPDTTVPMDDGGFRTDEAGSSGSGSGSSGRTGSRSFVSIPSGWHRRR